jgi:hypothetical protein
LKARRQGWCPRVVAKSALERDRASEVAQDRECLSVRSDLADVRRLVEQRPQVHRPLGSTAGPVESSELVAVERDLDGVLSRAHGLLKSDLPCARGEPSRRDLARASRARPPSPRREILLGRCRRRTSSWSVKGSRPSIATTVRPPPALWPRTSSGTRSQDRLLGWARSEADLADGRHLPRPWSASWAEGPDRAATAVAPAPGARGRHPDGPRVGGPSGASGQFTGWK